MKYILIGVILFIILFLYSAIKLGKEADEKTLKEYNKKNNEEQKIWSKDYIFCLYDKKQGVKLQLKIMKFLAKALTNQIKYDIISANINKKRLKRYKRSWQYGNGRN